MYICTTKHVPGTQFQRLELRTPYGLRGGNAPWFICWFLQYISRLFLCLLNFLPHFLHSLLSSFLMISFLLVYFWTIYIYTSCRIDPFCFQAGGRRRWPKPGVSFLGSFNVDIVDVNILLWMHVCFCCVCFSFSVLSQKISWEACLRNDLFCVG